MNSTSPKTGGRPARYRGAGDHDSLAKEVRPTVRQLFAELCASHPTAAELKVWAFLVGEIALDARLWDALSTYRIGEVTGLDRSNVRRALRRLEELRIVEIQSGSSERDGRRTLSVIGFGPGAVGPPVTLSDRGLFRPKTGGYLTPRPGAVGPPTSTSSTASAGPSRRPAGAGAAQAGASRGGEAYFVQQWDEQPYQDLTEGTVAKMAKKAGLTVDYLFDIGLVRGFNSMIRLDQNEANNFRGMKPSAAEFAATMPDVKFADTMHTRALQAGYGEEFAQAAADAVEARNAEKVAL